MRPGFRLSILTLLVLLSPAAVIADDPPTGPIVCETYFGCRRFNYGSYVACRCDTTTTCTECCLVDTAECWVSP
jgi:hypothetical protein